MGEEEKKRKKRKKNRKRERKKEKKEEEREAEEEKRGGTKNKDIEEVGRLSFIVHHAKREWRERDKREKAKDKCLMFLNTWVAIDAP